MDGNLRPAANLDDFRAHAPSPWIELAAQSFQHSVPGGSSFMLEVIDTIGEPLFVKDQDLNFLMVNQALCEFAGLRPDQFIGRSNADLLHADQAAKFNAADRLAMSSGKDVVNEEVLHDARGRARLIRTTKRMFVGAGGRKFLVGICTDLTELRQAQRKLALVDQHLETLAHRDALTGLLNRAAFEDLFEQTVAGANPVFDSFTLLFMDLKGFKRVNDTHGHALGDKFLQAIALRIAAATRTGDSVARLGGNEFILLAREGDQADVARMAGRIAETVALPVDLPGAQARTPISIGIARYPVDGLDADALWRNAVAAMRRAKADSHTPYVFHDQQHSLTTTRQQQLENQLMQDVPNGRIRMEVQPIVSLSDAAVVGYEALARWEHPLLGRVAPDEFIPLAEKLQLIDALGESLLRQACQFLADAGQPGQYVSVNVSGLQFRDPRFAPMLRQILEQTGARPQQLALELTETALAAPGTSETLKELQRSGVAIFLDDFGVGYSNLTRLHQLSFDAIKVDRGFVAGIESGGIAVAMVKTIVSLAGALGVRLIAEGIETPRQTQLLLEMGIPWGQGYLYGRPVHPSSAEPGPMQAVPAG